MKFMSFTAPRTALNISHQCIFSLNINKVNSIPIQHIQNVFLILKPCVFKPRNEPSLADEQWKHPGKKADVDIKPGLLQGEHILKIKINQSNELWALRLRALLERKASRQKMFVKRERRSIKRRRKEKHRYGQATRLTVIVFLLLH